MGRGTLLEDLRSKTTGGVPSSLTTAPTTTTEDKRTARNCGCYRPKHDPQLELEPHPQAGETGAVCTKLSGSLEEAFGDG